MSYHILAESFETFVPWSKLINLCKNVKNRLKNKHYERKFPGIPMTSCRVTQVYDNGACI